MGRKLASAEVPGGWPFDGYFDVPGQASGPDVPAGHVVEVRLSSGRKFVLEVVDAAEMRDLLNECDLNEEA